MRSIRNRCAVGTLAALALCAFTSGARAQASPAPAPATAPQAASTAASAPPVDLPVIPHEKEPGARPYPDYLAEALKQTTLVVDGRFKEVRLSLTQDKAPRYVVLPIQTQAFGFAPAFRALIAAHLDHELARRGIDSSHQTDVVDGYGPFVRRLDDASVQALAGQHPSSALLALHLGHDGIETAFVTLVLKEGQKAKTVHRDVKLPAGPREAASALAAVLPDLLGQLKLGAAAAAPAGTPKNLSCTAQAWELNRPAVADTTALACHAIVLGTLLPEFERRLQSPYPSPNSPARLAWLATAFVEAAEHAATAPSLKSIQDLAWFQLQLDDDLEPPIAHVQSQDPVTSRLAKLLTAPMQRATAPARSGRGAVEQYVGNAAKGLPAFAQAVFNERGNYGELFRRVDLCAIERQLPGMMVSAKCRSDQAPTVTAAPARRANAYEAALYQEWRLASFQKDIHYYGETLGQLGRLSSLLAALPDDVARHPFIRQQRFVAEAKIPFEGNFAAYLQSKRVAASAYVQSMVDAQRYDMSAEAHSISRHVWVKNSNVRYDKTITQLSDDEKRLIAVLKFDRYATNRTPPIRRTQGYPAVFLSNSSVGRAETEVMLRSMRRTASPAPGNRTPAMPAAQAASAPERHLFALWSMPQSPSQVSAFLQEQIAQEPANMEHRVQLAMHMLKQGSPTAEARRVIDAQPRNSRSDEQIDQSHAWSLPADAFFFAADTETAKLYYERVRETRTGSGPEMRALGRLRQIDGDIPGAIAATEAMMNRYEGEFVRRDLTGLLFMSGQRDRAWSLLTPRLASASTLQLWLATLVGQRIDGLDLAATKEWTDRQGLAGAQADDQDATALLLHLHGTTDRLPTDADISLLQRSSPRASDGDRWAASARLVRMVMRDTYGKEDFDEVRAYLLRNNRTVNNAFMQPLFTWVAWHATRGKEPQLEWVRLVGLDSGQFSVLLSKSMLLALEGQTHPSLEFLRAARYQMSELGQGGSVADQPVPSGYLYALAGYLMYRKTGQEAYRAETLRFAQAQQQMAPYWAWPYAMEALLSTDNKRRTVALCRARHLDAASYFLAQAKPANATCKKGLWPAS